LAFSCLFVIYRVFKLFYFCIDKVVTEFIKEFLSAGMSASPREIFLKKFWNQGIAQVERSLDEAEKLANKLGRSRLYFLMIFYT
jgi:hypothetical protein